MAERSISRAPEEAAGSEEDEILVLARGGGSSSSEEWTYSSERGTGLLDFPEVDLVGTGRVEARRSRRTDGVSFFSGVI